MTEVPQWVERFVLLYFSGADGRARAPEVFPAHHAYTLDFQARRPGELLLTGPFAEPVEGQPGAMNVFTSRQAGGVRGHRPVRHRGRGRLVDGAHLAGRARVARGRRRRRPAAGGGGQPTSCVMLSITAATARMSTSLCPSTTSTP